MTHNQIRGYRGNTMSRIQPVTEELATGEIAEIYRGIRSTHGRVPNIFQLMANAPAVLKAYLSLSDLLKETSLSLRLREQIALAVGQLNGCEYCLAAHSAAALNAGLSHDDIESARVGEASDPKVQAILHFVRRVVEIRGWVTDREVEEVKAAGVNDREIAEIVLAVSLNMYTNYFNHVMNPAVDFPQVHDIPRK